MEIGLGKLFATAIVAALPLMTVALGLAWIFTSSISTVGRNPGASDRVMPITILGFAMTEAIALFALLIAFLILFG